MLRNIKWFSLAGLMVVALATPSFAAPTLSWPATDLQSEGLAGYTGYLITVNANDGQSKSIYADLTFTADAGTSFNQISAFGGAVGVDTESTANTYDAIPTASYDKALDTWYVDASADWGVVPGTSMSVDASGTEELVFSALATAAGSYYESAPIAYIVANGSFSFNGTISRDMADYSVSGVVPEPTTMCILGIGAAAGLIRRRNKR